VVHPFHSIQIPLMDRIHSQITRPATRLRSAPFPIATFVGRVA
jgi:hypothetical protein